MRVRRERKKQFKPRHTMCCSLCNLLNITGNRLDMVERLGNEVVARGVEGVLSGKIDIAA